MWFSLLGLAVTLALNALLVPHIGYMGCAIAALASYFTMMVTSYFVGRRYHPIDYPTSRILGYFAVAAVCYVVGMYCMPDSRPVAFALRFVILAAFVYYVVRREGIHPLQMLSQLKHRRAK